MIESLVIKDFQSLSGVNLDLGKITLLVGESNRGKSAVLRALRGLCEYRWHKGYVTHGREYVTVTLVCDGHTIKWQKGEKVNRYYLDGKLYDKVGKDVPQEIKDVLNLREVEFDVDLKESINFHSQMDGHFLLSRNSSEMGKILGKITHLNLFYVALRSCNRDALENKRSLQETKRLLDEAMDKVDRLDGIVAVEKYYERTEELLNELREKESAHARAVELNEELTELLDEEERLSKRLKVLAEADGILKKIEEVEEVRRGICFGVEYIRIGFAISVMTGLYNECCAVEADLIRAEEAESLVQVLRMLKGLQDKIDGSKEKMTAVEGEIKCLEDEFKKHLKKIGSCPYCLRDFHKVSELNECVKRVLS